MKRVSEEILGDLAGSRRSLRMSTGTVARRKRELDTRPSDVVRWSGHPYEPARVMLDTDLKRYLLGSLKKAHVRGAVTRLCTATDCANLSAGWRNLYGDDPRNCRCHGLLFVYHRRAEVRQPLRKQLPWEATGSEGPFAE